jgi:ADP-heptose:LPS heptosyltransferase
VKDASIDVVVLFPGALGDLVLVVPALRRWRARRPDARVTLAVAGWLRALASTSGVADAYASLDDADAVGLFGGARMPSWFGVRPHVVAWIGASDPDVRARLEALASGVELFGVVRGDGPEHAAGVYARQLGVPNAAARSAWASPPSERAALAAPPGGPPLLAVHAGAGARAKRWAHEGFVEIARRWRADGGAVIEVVGPADADVTPIPDARRAVDWPLPDLLALLARVTVYVGNDTGVSHLAGAAGAPGVVVFGPTAARRWAPRGGHIESVQASASSVGGITTTEAPIDAVWRGLMRRSRLDKLQGRT